MRELDLFAQYLIRVRGERLQASHAQMVSAKTIDEMKMACVVAHEADLCTRLAAALKDLSEDPGKFVERHLK